MDNKFNIGDKVRFVGDLDTEAGRVLSYSYSLDRGFVYTISSSTYDMSARQIVDGIKTCLEDELVEVKDET